MLQDSVEKLKTLQGYGEIVDVQGKPLCIMRHRDISQQHLMHLSCVLLVIDKNGNMVLKKEKDGWNVSSHTKLPAWESHETCAQNLLTSEWKIDARLAYQGLCLPCPENDNSHSSVFHAKIESVARISPRLDMEQHLVANKSEISMLCRLEKFFSPMLQVLFGRKLI